MIRTFKTRADEPSDDFKKRIGAEICQLIHPLLLEIVHMEQHPTKKLLYIMTLEIVGNPTELANETLMKRTESPEVKKEVEQK